MASAAGVRERDRGRREAQGSRQSDRDSDVQSMRGSTSVGRGSEVRPGGRACLRHGLNGRLRPWRGQLFVSIRARGVARPEPRLNGVASSVRSCAASGRCAGSPRRRSASRSPERSCRPSNRGPARAIAALELMLQARGRAHVDVLREGRGIVDEDFGARGVSSAPWRPSPPLSAAPSSRRRSQGPGPRDRGSHPGRAPRRRHDPAGARGRALHEGVRQRARARPRRSRRWPPSTTSRRGSAQRRIG